MKRETTALTLHAASRKSDHGIYTGNGFTGAVLWGPSGEWNVSLDRSDVWDLRQLSKPWRTATFEELREALDRRNWTRVQDCVMRFSTHPKNALPTPTNMNLGRFTLGFSPLPEPIGLADRMDLAEGALTRTLRRRGAALRGDIWVDPVEPVVWIELRATGRSFSAKLALRRVPFEKKTERPFRYPSPVRGREGSWIWWALQLHPSNAYALVLRVFDGSVTPHGNVRAPASKIVRLGIAIEKAETIAETIQRGRERLESARWRDSRRTNRRWWRAFWRKSNITLSDAGLEQAWRVGLYQLACCSRPGSPPVTLQGVWSPDGSPAPWLGLVFNNLNTQMCYWPAAAANHLELIEPFVDFFTDPQRIRRMEEETRDYFHMPGLAVPVGADLLGRRVHSWMVVQSWPMTGAWICQHLWDYYKHSGDLEFLRQRAYPYFKRNLEFLRAFYGRDRDGKTLIWPSHSPELFDAYDHLIWQKNPTIDLWLLKALLSVTLEAARLLGADSRQCGEWRKWLKQVPGYVRARERGYLTESDDVNTELSHRHLSCCAPVYPGSEIHVEGKDRALAIASVRQLVRRGSGLWMGFSHVWLSCLAARVGLANMAAHQVRIYWEHYTGPSKFHLNLDMTDSGISDCGRAYYTSEPMSTESSIGAAAAVNEMLLQSWGGVIRVFPSLPAEIDGSFRNLLAEGGVSVSARRTKGEVREIRVMTRSERRIRLRIPSSWKGIVINPAEPIRRVVIPRGVNVSWNARAGRWYRCVESAR